MELTLPAVRFVRCFDIREYRMRNIFMRITTQDQLANAPRATELTVTAQTVEGAMVEIRRWAEVEMSSSRRWLRKEDLVEIEKASHELINAQDSVYEVL
jgi:hypothetical protein